MILPIFIFLFGLTTPDSKQFEISIDAGINLPGNEKWVKRLKLSDEQIKIADNLVNLYVKENHQKYKYTGKIDHYFDYYRQYIGYLSGETKNTIFVNAFYSRESYMTDDFLTSALVAAKGGGSHYFTIKVNLKEMICYDLSVNAPL
jgi:hypothetical protein